MTGKAKILKHADWTRDVSQWRGRVEGKDLGTNVTVLFYATDKIGAGPVLHVHTYDEVFIIREGRALFTVGKEKIEAEAGDIVFGPANVPHKFANLGAGRLETTDIHLSDHFAQEELDDPEVKGE
jgi:mannose-6-phosphate isomerase-like protein (cupin superfamily)